MKPQSGRCAVLAMRPLVISEHYEAFCFEANTSTKSAAMINCYLQALLTKSEIELKLSQCRIQYVQSKRRPPTHRTKQTSALAVREKHQMQFTHSRAEPRPPGSALRKRSKMASGPRSLVMRWLKRNVANDPKTRTNHCTWNQNAPGLGTATQQEDNEQNWNRNPKQPK
jgi:hypothetical protein